jgi:hypothetical protein
MYCMNYWTLGLKFLKRVCLTRFKRGLNWSQSKGLPLRTCWQGCLQLFIHAHLVTGIKIFCALCWEEIGSVKLVSVLQQQLGWCCSIIVAVVVPALQFLRDGRSNIRIAILLLIHGEPVWLQ